MYDAQNHLTRVETPARAAISTRRCNSYGYVTEYRDWVTNDRQTMTYDLDGRLLTQKNYVNTGTLQSQIFYNHAGSYSGSITGITGTVYFCTIRCPSYELTLAE